MKPFSITLIANEPDGKVYWQTIIEGNSLAEIFSKLLLEQLRLQEILMERSKTKEIIGDDDDIPF